MAVLDNGVVKMAVKTRLHGCHVFQLRDGAYGDLLLSETEGPFVGHYRLPCLPTPSHSAQLCPLSRESDTFCACAHQRPGKQLPRETQLTAHAQSDKTGNNS